MSFLYPYFLYGLSAITIPVIIHLFNLQKTKKVFFSNTAFLKNVQSRSQRSIQIKNLLVLLCRIMFIVFLVFSFSQPLFNSTEGIQRTQEVNIFIDNSLSSESMVANDKVLDLSIKNIEELSKGLPESSIINIITNEFFGYKGQNISKEKVPEIISDIKFSARSRSFQEILNKKSYSRELRKKNEKKLFYIFSDFQKSTMGAVGGVKIDKNTSYFLAPITPVNTSNLYIDSVWLENPYANVNLNNTISIKIVNSGGDEKTNIPLKLSIEGRQVASTSISLNGNSNNIASFNFAVNTPGIKKAVISISESPVSFDNEYYLSFKTLNKIRIMELTGSEFSPYIEKIYGNDEKYYFQQKSVSNVDYGALEEYHLVILNNLKNLEDGLIESLQKFISNGGTLQIIPSEDLEISSFNKLLNKYSVILNKKSSTDSLGATVLNQPDMANPFFGGVFEGKERRMIMPTEKSLVSWNNIGINHLVFAGGNPFLSQINSSDSKIFIFASDLKGSNGLPLNAIFVPVMDKIGLLSNSISSKLAYNFNDEIITLPIVTSKKNDLYKLVKDGVELIPGQRIIGKSLTLEIPSVEMLPGHYDVQLNGKTVDVIAINYGKEESQMNFYSSEELKTIFDKFNNVEVLNGTSQQQLLYGIQSNRQAYPLWKICLCFALFFLLLEILLIRFYKLHESSPKVSPNH